CPIGGRIMRVFIIEWDKDYNSYNNTIEKEFESLQEAEEWCREASGSGYVYFIDSSLTKSVNGG
ncbi:hypothetical protein, partial [Escherichia coli]|uniref:hypothetical protein n=1 Tax=Escherichia coli TaxID=562 RepID=UPI001BE478E3